MKKDLHPASLVEILSDLKDVRNKGITFIGAGNKEEFLSYQELYNGALSWLGYLQNNGLQPGDELILQIEDNKTFLQLFWACILGAIVPVPVSITYHAENLQKLFKIKQYLNNPYIVTSRLHYEKLFLQNEESAYDKPQFDKVILLEDKGNYEGIGALQTVSANTIAFLQFSSGSTGSPKGVVLTHKNLITNLYAATSAHQCTEQDSYLSWMPLTHDMGLIGFHLYPMAAGVNHYIMPTDLFIRNPLLWLQKVSEHHVSIICSPNFGYKYYLNQFSEEKVKGLDLSSVRIILNGAEPVSAELCRTFMDTLGKFNLHPMVMCPGYGLAEATLEVTFTGIHIPLKSRFVSRGKLTIGSQVVNNEENASDSIEVVNLGRLISGVDVKITDTKGKKLNNEHLGIIWIKGDAVTNRYYNNEAATKSAIKEDGWLNTGDTGFIAEDCLYVVGRVKDIIFVNGTNVYPHDLEQIIEQLDEIEAGKAVACGIPDEETGSESIAVFVIHKLSIEKFLSLAATIRRHVAARMGLEIKYVIPIRKIFKTTSGKIKRYAFVEEYNRGTYDAVIREIEQLTSQTREVLPHPVFASNALTKKRESIQTWIMQWLESRLGLKQEDLKVKRTFAEYGMSSMQAVAFAADLESYLSIPLDNTVVYNFSTVDGLTDYLLSRINSTQNNDSDKDPEKTSDKRIAVIGMGCRFPGNVNSPEDFWSLLKEQKNAITVIPQDRWNTAEYFNEDENAIGKMYTRHGGFINDVDKFDPSFFGISAKEAECMDPQHRLLLEVSWEALEHAGIPPSKLRGSDSGIFIGMGTDDYQQLIQAGKDISYFNDAFTGLGLERSIAAGRLAYFFDFHGPVVQLDTACSSSLLSVHQACQNLVTGECSLALAGGVNLMLSPDTTVKLCQMKALSPSGSCKTFDDQADGYVRGEGAGIVVLKRLSDALADGDNIVAVISGSAVNHDGLSNGLTAPNGIAQQGLIQKALNNADLSASEVQYVEAHGTGTRLGDPIEVLALNAVYGRSRPKDQSLLVGAVKTQIGHLEAAAGIAGFIKTALCLYNQEIPGNLHYEKPNKFIPWNEMSVSIADSLRKWNITSGKRRGAVSAFGLSGTNVHVILEEFNGQKTEVTRKGAQWPSYPIFLSARTPDALKSLAKEYSAYLNKAPQALQDISYSSAVTREVFSHRLAFEAVSAYEAVQYLDNYQQGNSGRGVEGSVAALQEKIVWLFTGQGSQYWQMGKELYENNIVFKNVIDKCDNYLSCFWDIPLTTLLYEMDREKSNQLLQQTLFTQPALYAIECALAEVWKSWGIAPSMVAGHSVGEYAAAYVAGVFSLEDGLKLITERARLMHSLGKGGMMAAVFAEESFVADIILPYGKALTIAAKNGPELITISGEKEALTEALKSIKQAGVNAKELAVSHAFHSSLMEPVIEAFRKVAESINYKTPTISIISNLNGSVVTDEITQASYWCRHILSPVLFSKSITTIKESGGTLLMELGPQPHLLTMAQLTSSFEQSNVLASMRQGQSAWSTMLHGLMTLYVKGMSIDWDKFYDNYCHKVPLPTYPFQRRRYWLEQDNLPSSTNYHHITKQQMISQNTIDNTSAQSSVLKEIITIFGDLLKASPGEINIHARFLELGADSLVLVNAIRRIEKKYGLVFSIKQVFEEVNTLELMAHYIVEHISPQALSQDEPVHPIHQVTDHRSKVAIESVNGNGISHALDNGHASLMQRQLDIMEQQLKLLAQLGNGSSSNGHPIASSSKDFIQQESHVKSVNGEILQNGKTSTAQKRPSIFPKIETTPGNAGFTIAQQEYLDEFIKQYTEKTKTSKALTQQYRSVLADNRASAGFRFSTKELVYPIQAVSCKGSKLMDVDGNEYVDLAMGFGVNLLGHNPGIIREALQQKIQEGYLLGPQTPFAGEAATLIATLTGMERVSFHNSGTEAVMTAIRLARTVTRKNKIAIFSGSYHGHFDGTLAAPEDLATTSAGVPLAPGILSNMVADILIFDYTNPAVVQEIRKHAHELAAVLVEPVQSRRPAYQPGALLNELREMTLSEDIVLIFDEMITGFRIHPGGAQAYFGVSADLATYGKIVGGGLPIGVIAGKKRFMDALDGGIWNYGDNSYPQADTTFFAGTFCKHPLSMTSTVAILKELQRQGPALQEKLNSRTSGFVHEIRAFFEQNKVPIQINNFGSQFYFSVTSNMDLFFYHLVEKGVYLWEGKTCFLSTAHTDEDVKFITRAIKDSIKILQKHGFLPSPVQQELLIDTESAYIKLEEIKYDNIQLPPIEAAQPKSSNIPLSFGQERLWFIDQLEGSMPYHIPMVLRLKGALNQVLLNKAIQSIVNRHEVLRGVIDTTAELIAQRLLQADQWNLTIVDNELFKEDADALKRHLTELVNLPFDLTRDFMLRAHLIVISEAEHVLILTAHHIAFDGLSAEILLKELAELYNAYLQHRLPNLTPLNIQYSDYAIWQQSYLNEMNNKLNYWKNKLAGVSPLNLPTDQVKPVIDHTSGSETSFSLPSELIPQLQQLSRQQNVTLYMLLLATFKVLLHRYTGQDDICIGSSSAGRMQEEVEGLIGFFVNTMVLRSDLSNNPSFTELLQRVKQTTLEAYEHQEVSFEKIVREVVKARVQERNPLVQVLFEFEKSADLSALNFENIQLQEEKIERTTTMFDLTFNVLEHSDNQISLKIEYCKDLFHPETIERFFNHYNHLLKAILTSPFEEITTLAMLTESEQKQLLKAFNPKSGVPFPKDKTLVDLFEIQARLTPEAIAVVFENKSLTYKEFDERSNQLAHYLRNKGVQQESLVPICIDRSLEMIVGILGIMKAGGAYVPIDPVYPSTRISFILEDCKASVIVSTDKAKQNISPEAKVHIIALDTDAEIIEKQPATPLSYRINPDNLAYVIYTSGSTGRPKGVMVEQIGMVNHLFAKINDLSINDLTILAYTASYTFDISVWQMFAALVCGGQTIIYSDDIISNPAALLKAVEKDNVTIVELVPSYLSSLLHETSSVTLKSLQYMVVTGEALSQHLLKQWFSNNSYSAIPIVNAYGPTEASDDICHHFIYDVPERVNIPLGSPVQNMRIYILDKAKQLCAIGVSGEICVAGVGVSRGYLNRPDLTGKNFLKDPFSSDTYDRMYCTGDLGRWLPDGTIEFQGRIDDQVKIRGFRIEIGEIEGVLQQCNDISGAVVVAKADSDNNKTLVAYIVPNEKYDKQLVLDYLKQRLPDYMVPSILVELDKIPLTANGKTDKQALQEPDYTALSTQEYAPARNKTEQKLVNIWQQLLNIDKIGINDNFFELGGHSLLATRIVSSIRKELDVQLTVKDFFVAPTVAQLADHLKKSDKRLLLPSIEVQPRPDRIPLSFSQERLWFIDQLEGTVAYHMSAVFRLIGKLNVEALEYALKTIVNRHEALRTVIIQEDGLAYQSIQEKDQWKLIKSKEYKENAEALESYIQSVITTPFDLSKDHMLRGHLLALDTNEHLLVLTLHHIACDGLSTDIIVKELAELYKAYTEGRTAELNVIPIQFADYTLWQHSYLSGEVLKEKLAYWKEKLQGTSPLNLPTDYIRPLTQSFRGGIVGSTIDKDLATQLQQLSQKQNVTPFMTWLAVFKVLLYRHSGQHDVCVGTPVAGRNQQELEELIGFFVNAIALRSDLSNNPLFTELLQQVKQTTLDAFDHQDVPFEKVVDLVVPNRDLSRNPLCPVVFSIQNTPDVSALSLGEVQLSREELGHTTSVVDMNFSVTENPDGTLSLNIEYCSDLFRKETMELMLVHFEQLARSVVSLPGARIGTLPMLTVAEEHQLLVDFNLTETKLPDYSRKTSIDLFTEQVVRTPKATAAIFKEDSLTYETLNERSNQLAHYLKKRGVKAETLVPLCIERSLDMMVGILGIMKAGGAYVPVDPTYPEDRIQYMIEDTQAKILVGSGYSRSKLQLDETVQFIELDNQWEIIGKESKEEVNTQVSPNDLAYVIYTSGSTGKPKGVEIVHSGLVNLACSQIDILGLRAGMTVIQFATFSFDASCSEIFTTLLSGSTLIIPTQEEVLSAESLIGLINQHSIDVVTLPPSYQVLIKEHLGNINTIISAGEPLNPSLAKELQSKGVRIFNAYGPTENTVCVTMSDNPILPGGTITIGKPIHNVEVYIVDEHFNIVPIGVPGELCTGGVQVARGYLNRPALTEEKFIKNSFTHDTTTRLYRTGDLARWLPDGNIEYLGRIDNQIKIAGHRIECGEIETVLMEHPLIETAAVVLNEKYNGKLAAFYNQKEMVELWPSIAEFFIYDDIVYRSMYTHRSRNDQYKAAFQKVLAGKTVLEIGPGPEAILSRLCIEAGAKHVYAVEILEETYLKAKKCLESLGLTDKITLIHSDIQSAVLPEKVDYCVSEIVGSIAGSEGAAVLIDYSKRFLKDPAHMIPARSITKIAAITLEESEFEYSFSDIAYHYVEQIESSFGKGFEFRICLKNLKQQNIISSHEVFEDLNYAGELIYEHSHDITLKIIQDSIFNGFYIWMDLYLDDVIHFDILEDQESWIPVYFPVAYPGYSVQKGDQITATISRKLSSNNINPDYFIKGLLVRSDGSTVELSFDSYHHKNVPSDNPFYQKLFNNGSVKQTSKLESANLRQYLSKYLPEYMIPAAFIPLETIPLTVNGKIDRKGLMKLDFELEGTQKYVAPSNEAEQALVNIWEELLGVEQVGIHDNFFELGGDSIITIQVVSRARRLGYQLQVGDIFSNQTIAQLIPLLSTKKDSGIHREEVILQDNKPFGLVPVQHWFFGKSNSQKNHYNQSVLLGIDKNVESSIISSAISQLVNYHDALRLIFRYDDKGWEQVYGNYKGTLEVIDFQSIQEGNLEGKILECGNQYQQRLDFEQGILIRAVLILTPSFEKQNRLLLVIHHLAIDGVSWRILLEDFELLLKDKPQKAAEVLGPKSSSYRNWYEALVKYSQTDALSEQLRHWENAVLEYLPLKTDKVFTEKITQADLNSYVVRLNASNTQSLLQEVSKAYHTEINDLLLSALALSLSNWSGASVISIGLEGHGRENISPDIEVSNTIGWFTSLYPAFLKVNKQRPIDFLLKDIKEQLRQIPDKGIGYGVLKYIKKAASLVGKDPWDIAFNYLGQLDNVVGENSYLSIAPEPTGAQVGEDFPTEELLSVNSMVQGGELILEWNYSNKHYEEQTIRQLSSEFLLNLEKLIAHCVSQTVPSFTPSDFGLGAEITHEAIDEFLNAPYNEIARRTQVESLYRLSGLQEGMLFHGLYDKEAAGYIDQFFCDSVNLKTAVFEQSLNYLLQRHTILRSAFYYEEFSIPVQCVYHDVKIPIAVLDYRDLSGPEKEEALKKYEVADREKGFDFTKAPLMRVTLIRLEENRYRLLWTFHHILLDGWSFAVLLQELLNTYELLVTEKPVVAIIEDRYEDYILYINRQNKNEASAYWKQYLSDIETGTLLPFIDAKVDRTKGSGTYNEEVLKLDVSCVSRLLHYVSNHRITVSTLMQGIWSYLLCKYTGQKNITYGVIVSSRPEDLPEVEQRVGLYINTLPLHEEVNELKNIGEWLQDIQTNQQKSRAYQYTALNTIQQWIGVTGDLFDSIMVFDNYPINEEIFGRHWSLKLENLSTFEKANYPLLLTINSSEEVTIQFGYNTSLLTKDCVQMIRGHFEHVLLQIISNEAQSIKDIKLLTDVEHKNLLSFSTKSISYPQNKTFTELFVAQSALTPNSPALRFEEQSMSYLELDERSNQLAHYLRSEGINAGSLVPLFIERSIEMIVGMLGILKAGGAYVPIDQDFPQDRIGYIVEDVAAKVILTSNNCRSKLPYATNAQIIALDGDSRLIDNQSTEAIDETFSSGNLLYVIYTSGSTGKPKGVTVTHRNLVDYLYGLQAALPIDRCVSFGLLSSFATDLGNTVLFSSLITGGCLHVFSKEASSDGDYLHSYFTLHSVDCIKIVPSHWKALSSSGALLPEKLLIFGGEALETSIVDSIRLANSSCTIVNHYGPTETTIGKLLHVVDENNNYQHHIPIGKPFSNTSVYVLNQEGQLCPVGVPGELYIGGDGVTPGYLNNKTLTDAYFITNPINPDDHIKIYRTGDIVKYLPDGNILFIGRADDQVKIRGYRIELGEVERVLQQCALINQCVVVAKGNQNGDKKLVAYIIAAGEFDRESILTYLKDHLPDYMIPSILAELEKFPFLPNGKIDKKSLPDPDAIALSTGNAKAETVIEKRIAAIWCSLLEIDEVGIHDNFFTLGGHSLLAIRLVSAIRKELSSEISIGEVFDYPTISSLTAKIESHGRKNKLPELTASPRPSSIPLSYGQERLWFIDQLEGSIQYHTSSVLRMKGWLNIEALSMAFQAIINRHEVLRSVIVTEDGIPFQKLLDGGQWQLSIADNASNIEEGELHSFIHSLIITPFDLSKDYLLRAHLIPLANSENILVTVIHHIASDGWSNSILVKELASLYEFHTHGYSDSASLPELNIQYADYAIWQRKYMTGNALNEEINYWKNKLSELSPLQLPLDYSRPVIQSTRGASKNFHLSKEILVQLQSLSQQQGATLFMTLLAAFKVILYRYSSQEDICVGSPIAGRNQQEVENLIGFFVNVLALRSKLAGNPAFTTLLQQVKQVTLEAYEHQQVPFEKIVEEVVTERDQSRSPIFQVMFDFQQASIVRELSLQDIQILPEEVGHKTTQYDLSFFIEEGAEGLMGSVVYCADLFDAATIENMIGHFSALLKSIIDNPGKQISALPILSPEEERQLLVTFNKQENNISLTDKTIVDLFVSQAASNPDNIAIVHEQRVLTYKDLDEQSNQLAHYLISKGVKTETLVPICMERSVEMIIGILGIMKAGGAYVPIEPDYPADRISYILSDLNAAIIISSNHHKNKLQSLGNGLHIIILDKDQKAIRRKSKASVNISALPQQLAYVMYTSGSTGKPKGVMIEHQNVVSFLNNYADKFHIEKGFIVGATTNYIFDISVLELIAPLMTGNTLHLVSDTDPLNILELIEQDKIDVLQVTPSRLSLLMDAKENSLNIMSRLKVLLVGGEALSEHFYNQLKELPETKVINVYGPTETTIWSTYLDIHNSSDLSIGSPLINEYVYILSPQGNLVPVGVPGEIHIAGSGLGRGYLKRPDLTEEKFISNYFSEESGAKMYKTGDSGKWLKDGTIEYLGRLDDQVKLHGYRIELGEIEGILQQSDFVNSAVVLVKGHDKGIKRLVAYIVSQGDFEREKIDTYLKGKLPEYMIPSVYVEMDKLPLTANGKLDRRALPDPAVSDIFTTPYVAPRTEVERKLTSICEELLEVNQIGIKNNLFDLGIRSMLVMRLVALVQKEFGLQIPVRIFFELTTIEVLAMYIEVNQVELIPEFENDSNIITL